MDPRELVFADRIQNNSSTSTSSAQKHAQKGSRTSDLHLTTVLGVNVEENIKTKVVEVNKRVEEAKLKKKQEESNNNDVTKSVDETKNLSILETLDSPADIMEFALTELDIYVTSKVQRKRFTKLQQ